MENLTNQIIDMKSGKKFFVLRQAVYKGSTYYFCAEVEEDENDFKDKFVFLERIEKDGKVFTKEVSDKNLLSLLAKNIKLD